MRPDTPAVRIEAVTKKFGDVTAVDDVSLSIREGEFLTILGPSGAGKTSLLHMIAGFVDPTAGAIHIDGRDVTAAPPYERNIGMVFQSMALFPHMTVGENIAFPLEMRRQATDRIDERVAEMLELVCLPGVADRSVGELSGGQQQRVAIARGLAFGPSLLLLDEPLSSLDKKLREEMRRELLRIHRETDVTTVHVTHNQEEALTMADRIAVIREGEIVQHAPAQELYDHPNSAFVADFIGDTNLLSGTVECRDGTTVTVTLDGGDATAERARQTIECLVETETENGEHRASFAPGDRVQVGVRYERLDLGREVGTGNAFDATVTAVEFAGDTVTYDVTLADMGARLSVTELNEPGSRVFDRGETVRVGWDPADAFVYGE